MLSNEVKNFVSPTSALGGKSIFEDAAIQISSAYTMFDDYASKHNLTILQVLDVFSSWLDKMKKEKKPWNQKNLTQAAGCSIGIPELIITNAGRIGIFAIIS